MEYKLPWKDYNEALKKGKLLGLKCKDCGTVVANPKMVCRKCAGPNLDIVELSGKGSIKSFTTIYVAAEGRQNECPYTVVLVQLDEGPWTMGNLMDQEPAKLALDKVIGKRVKMMTKVFPGDKYTAGDQARPLFVFDN
jgi:uncharacterized protein